MANPKSREVAAKMIAVLGGVTAVLGVAMVLVPAAVQGRGEPIMGSLLLISALISAVATTFVVRTDARVYHLLLAAVSLTCGIIIFVYPLDTSPVLTLPTLLGFFFMVEGAIVGGMAAGARRHKDACVILAGFASVSVVMSLLIWISVAGAPEAVFYAMVGIAFIARGGLYLMFGRWMKTHPMMQPDEPAPPPSEPDPVGG